MPGWVRRLPWRGAVGSTRATRPRLLNAAVTRPLPPFTHQVQERFFVRRGAGTLRRSVRLLMPSRTRPMLRGPMGERRARQPLRRATGQTLFDTRRTKKPAVPSEYQISRRLGTNAGLDIAKLLPSLPFSATIVAGATQ